MLWLEWGVGGNVRGRVGTTSGAGTRDVESGYMRGVLETNLNVINCRYNVFRYYSSLISVPPIISHISGASIIDAGTNLELTCSVTGIPQPVIGWKFNGQTLVTTTDQRVAFPAYNSMKVKLYQ